MSEQQMQDQPVTRKIPSLYYVATGCLHPEETYDQNIHMFGNMQSRNKIAQYSLDDITEYINKDIAWRVSLHSKERHIPSLKYVLTGTLHEDEPFDPTIHKSGREEPVVFDKSDPLHRNIRRQFMDTIIYYYEFNKSSERSGGVTFGSTTLPLPPHGKTTFG